METQITGHTLLQWGIVQGRHFGELLSMANDMSSTHSVAEIEAAVLERMQEIEAARPHIFELQDSIDICLNIEAQTDDERANVAAVLESMERLTTTPTIRSAAIMPDACPAGQLGTIPVGGVVVTENAIHPGMHSADICCSVMMSDFGDIDPKEVLDIAHEVTHFGPGGRHDDVFHLPEQLIAEMQNNAFLSDERALHLARTHLGTQGDGNHFLFVGQSRNTGRTKVITHHGSRGLGAHLYKKGMRVAEEYRKVHSPDTLRQNAWIVADSDDGRDYWDALQIVREWTKLNHQSIHSEISYRIGGHYIKDQFWNEHNFVFERNGLYHHGKGATPAWSDFADDATDLTLIPLNMAEPVLVVRGSDAPHGLGFSPHGAGRNLSRTEHKNRIGDEPIESVMAREVEGLDIRFFSGVPDTSELPSAYKNAGQVVEQIEKFELAEIVDYVDPYGCIMAGYIEPNWMKK